MLRRCDVTAHASAPIRNALTLLEANHHKLEALEESSVDFYAAMRSAYLQSRRAAIEGIAPLDAPPPEADTELAADTAL